MVLQTLLSRLLAFSIFLTLSCSGETTCVTSTEIDFTEKEACYYDELTQTFLDITQSNFKSISGASSGKTLQLSMEYQINETSLYKIISKVKKAEAIVSMESTKDIEKTTGAIAKEIELIMRKTLAIISSSSIQNILNDNAFKKDITKDVKKNLKSE